MINPQNQRTAKIVELFQQMNLFSEDELTWMEDYLSGAVEGEPSEKLPFRDLTSVPGDLAIKMRELVRKAPDQEVTKLCDLLFAIGQSTCQPMVPAAYEYFHNRKEVIFPDPAKKAAVYAMEIGAIQYMISRPTVQSLMGLGKEDPEILKKAISYQKGKNANGKLLLFMAYFQMKYPNVALVEEEEGNKQGGILAGVGRLFGRGEKAPGAFRQIPAKDMLLLQEYGEILAKNVGQIYSGQMSRLELDEIQNAVYRDKVDERILKMANANLSVNRYMLRHLGVTAFVNYGQSPLLKNVVRICLAADTTAMLDSMANMDLRDDMNKNGGDYDKIFGVDPKKLIVWAAGKGETEILKGQFQSNREIYLDCMNTAEFDSFNRMNGVVKKLDSGLYRERMGKDASRQQSKVIDAMVQIVDTQAAGAVRAYLEGDKAIDSLYPYEDKLQGNTNYRWGGKHWNILQSYQSTYGYDELSNRCEAFLMLYRGYANTNSLRVNSEIKGDKVKRLFEAVDKEGLSLNRQLNGYGDAYESLYLDRWKTELQNTAREIFHRYLKTRREETLAAFKEAGSTGRCLGLLILGEESDQNKEAILGFTQDSSKGVKEELLKILYRQKDWEEDMRKLLTSKKAGEREIAIRVLTNWDSEGYTSILTECLEKEKNSKVKALLETVLHISAQGGEAGEGGKALTREDMVKDLHKGGKKRSLAWAYETPFSTVHKKDGTEASEEYLQAVLLSYAAMSPCGVSPTGAMLAEDLDKREFAVYTGELFDKWMEAGAESKKRWVLYAAAIHGGADMVRKLHHQIQEWPNMARGAIASEAVQALALSPEPQALLIVDGISRKFKFKQVKAAAGKALDFAAAQLGITTEELADRIVPDLGFNENMERVFDYGERKFTVAITTALEIEVFDESGKKLKNLPAPGKRDDEVKAAGAYEEFKQMKKQMKTTVSSQKMRLEMALSTGRQWSVEAWKNLFVKNPVMHQFATGLIWGIYEDRKLAGTFRYMEDGSFNTEDEDEFELPETGTAAFIGIVHPIELSEDSRKAWKEQLEDYEITQPIEQLDRTVYYRTKEEEESKSLERFGGCIINDLSLGGKLLSMGWYRGSVQDGGGFYSYYREDKELGLGVELHFSGSFVGGENDDVTVYEVRFYNAGGTVLAGNGGVIVGNTKESTVPAGIKRGSYVYDEANDSNSYFLKEIPERYFSEIVLQLTRATAASKERDASWKSRK